MGNKNIKVNLDVGAKIESASKTITSLQNQLSKLSFEGGLGKQLDSILKSSEQEIIKIQKKLASGLVDATDLSSIEKVFSKIEGLSEALTKKMGSEGFASGGLKKDLEAIVALEKAQKAYENSIASTEKKRESLNKSVENAKKAHADLLEQQKSQSTVTEKELKEQKALEELYRSQVAEAKKLRKEAQENLQAKIRESGGKYTEAQMSQKGSGLRKTDAYKKYMEAQSKYDSALASYQGAQSKTSGMVTKAMQLDAIKEAEEAIKQAEAALESFNTDLGKTKESEAFEKMKESLKDLDLSEFGIDISEIKNVDVLKNKIKQLSDEAGKRAATALKEFEASAHNAEDDVRDLGKAIGGARVEMDGLTESSRQQDAFEMKIKQFLGMAGAAETLRRALKSAFSTIKELDATMTEMAVVTDLTVGDYWDQLPEYSKRASELGVSINSAYQAATLYYQQGLKSNEVTAISTETLKMAKIAGLSAADATDKMTAALRGFNMELNEASAQKIADVYSELAAITAADVDEISSAMTKTASIASSAGMEFETTAAFLSQIIETTRESAETAGTALKTVIARFQELKKDPSEIGEIDGEIVDANKIETALRSVGVALRDANGQFRDLDDVFLDLSSKWDSLDTNTQRYIATIAAGSRQQSRFIAMMSDYGRTQELVAAANDSAGASQKQFEKTMDSLEYKLEQLKNAWQEFSMGILNSDLVKVGVDILTKFLEIINKATSAFDGLGGSIVKVLSVVALFKLGQAVFDKFKAPLSQFFSSIVEQSYKTGYDAGKAMAAGTEAAKKDSEGSFQEKLDTSMSKKESSMLDKVGVTAIKEGRQVFKDEGFKKEAEKWAKMTYENEAYSDMSRPAAIKKARADKVKKVKDTENTLMGLATDGKTDKNSDAYLKAKKDMEAAQKELVDFDETQQKVQQTAQEGWNKVGEGMQQMGASVTAVGIGVSMLGGIFDSLGMSEVGETFSTVGNILTMVGGAISTIGTLVPIVTKILVASGYSVQGAWWPLLVIGLALAALIGTIMLIVSSIQAAEDAKLGNRMKAAAEATEEARKAAEEAKEAYDDLLEDRKSYDDMQKNLENLVYGTKEWKEALYEVNQQVLDLVSTYPELAKYMSRGADGQLMIADEGWDEVIANQEKMVSNTQNAVAYRQIEEQKLKMEGAKQDYTNVSTIYDYKDSDGYTVGRGTDSSGGYAGASAYKDTAATEAFQDALEDIYITSNSSLEEQADRVAELAAEYGITTKEVEAAGQALMDAKDEINQVAEQTENIARANLTATASEGVLNSAYGTEAIDAFASSMGSDYEQTLVDEQVTALKENKDYQDSDEFMRLAEEYGVKDEMTGSNTEDLQKLYAAMKGYESVDDIPDAIAENREEMLKEISAIDQGNQRQEKIEKYAATLEDIANNESKGGKDMADNLAGILSDDGLGMEADFAETLVKDGVFDKAQLEAYAEAFGGMEAWAAMTNQTVDELYEQAEENARAAVTTNKKTFSQLNRVLGKAEGTIKDFGKGAELSLENSAGLVDKIVEVAQMSGAEEAEAVKGQLDGILSGLGEDADIFAQALNGIDWQSASDWDSLQATIEALGLTWTGEMTEFVASARVAARAFDLINFDKLSEDLKTLYDTMKTIQSGEQGRTFDKDTYELLIASNKDLAKDFVQMGDSFYYLGNSMDNLTESLQKKTINQLDNAEKQFSAEKKIAAGAKDFTTKGLDGKTLDLSKGFDKWTEEEKRSYIEGFRDTMAKPLLDDPNATAEDFDILKYVTDSSGKSLGMSMTANFEETNETTLDAMLDGIKSIIDTDSTEWAKKEKQLMDGYITKYSFETAQENQYFAQKAFAGGDTTEALLRSKALQIQAVDSGMIAEAVLSEYSDLIQQLETGNYADGQNETKVTERLKELQDSMTDSLDTIIYNQEGVAQIIELQNRAAEALEKRRQDEIDKLSEINDSVNAANESLTNKIQEQINDARQDRENKKTEENISNQEARLAYLMRDTSGANASEILSLQKSLEQEKENYGDSLVDQNLQKLIDANEKAAEQREQQIEIMQAQLDYDVESGAIMQEAERMVNNSLDQINQGVNPIDTNLGKLLLEEEEWAKKSTEQFNQEMNNFNSVSKEAADARGRIVDQEKEVAENTGEIDDNTSSTDAELDGIDGAGLNEMVAAIKKKITSEQDSNDKRDTALSAGVSAIKNKSTGAHDLQNNKAYQNAKEAYIKAGGSAEKFDAEVKSRVGTITSGFVQAPATGLNEDNYAGSYDQDVVITLNSKQYSGLEYFADPYTGNKDEEQGGYKVFADDAANTALNSYVGGHPTFGQVGLYNGKPYIYKDGRWRLLYKDSGNKLPDDLSSAMKDYLNVYASGGLADFTGPAWLDGTKSRPELVLNAKDTQNFIALKDILSDVMNNTSGEGGSSGDNYYDIQINVDSLGNDYDVEQLADKLRKIIYEDATYRNVNVVNLIR